MAASDVGRAPVRVPLYSATLEPAGEIEMAADVFGVIGELAVVHAAVRMQLAGRRAGTAATKTKGLVSGGGRKPWRQKGTGRARAGSTRSPLWRHGGTIFGPRPRDYGYRLPKKAWRRALRLAISDRALGGRMYVVEGYALPELKTKAAQAMLGRLKLGHALIVFGEGEEQVARAARNLAAHKVLPLQGLNVYDVLAYDQLLMSVAVARAIEQRLGGRA
ncbi:MAG: 50S ribosomal protein L4 [Deltaproteobacteria bacterium]|jgi:large subunit ribosomal protein L4|nr:50S ribosomal protein L4 [Deltaproteobacteria bacterium]